MILVRYVALAALVTWLGAMAAPALVVAPAVHRILGMDPSAGLLIGEAHRRLMPVAYGCAGVLCVALFTMKFVGPPPRGFTARIAVSASTIAITAYADFLAQPGAPLPLALAIGAGGSLLFWYAQE